MLPASHRLRVAADYRSVLRGRRDDVRLPSARSGGRLLVLHVARLGAGHDHADAGEGSLPRVGFVVSKAVGGSVVRNRTKRVLRHIARARLDRVPGGVGVVVRAQPAAAGASTGELVAEYDRLLDQTLGRLR
ncbi:ribonuclease P protein component [Luteipulveratus sp. YIM 133132]|uniref:ribonuclease P protein component n=1 Tax=Luteipulveratus flavus TaxID=3031728 RepID=UPI0023B1A4A7|nr:ribonuclease P protein component [Luteipulveratus sp. YIM 133132]MDE9365377.1 ribonuclease P protein component [Luteipulveratus sp. YIM 133132]